MSALGHFYRGTVVVVWFGGALFFALYLNATLRVFNDQSSAFAILLTCLFSVVGMGASLYSFLAGAQPGHWVRAFNVLAMSLLCAIFFVGELNIIPERERQTIMLLTFSPIAILALRFGPGFKKTYGQTGQVDYFKIYFPRK